MRRLILISLLTLSVSGCLPVLFIAGGAAAGTALTKDNRSLQTISNDSDTEFRANTILQADREIANNTHVTATLFNGVLLLTGQAPTPALKQKTEALVKQVQDVRRIYNQITIAQPTGTFTRSDDVLTTGNVKAKMIGTKGLTASQFKVVTENGTVYLMGLASVDQTNKAVEAARTSTGVKQIVKLVEFEK